MNTPEIGPASSDDAAAAAELIHATDPGVWDYLFDGGRETFDTFARGLWSRPGNNFSASETRVVTDATDDRMVALEMGYRGDAEPALRGAMQTTVPELLQAEALAPLLERAQDIGYLTPHIPADAYYLHFLSVAPEARGRGLGRRLLEHAFERARSLGCDTVHLDVYCENPAVALYRAYDFRIAVETRFPGKPGLPPHYRMIRELT